MGLDHPQTCGTKASTDHCSQLAPDSSRPKGPGNVPYKSTNYLLLSRLIQAVTQLQTWRMRAKWHSAASSSPCFSAHKSMRWSRCISRWPISRVHRVELCAISRLNSHWLMKWNSCENSWIVSAAFTRARSSSDIVHDSRFTTSSMTRTQRTSIHGWTTHLFVWFYNCFHCHYPP